jgi:hypothetical protein
VVLGSIFALSSLPFIAPSLSGCALPPPNISLFDDLGIANYSTSWGPFLGLYIIPRYSVVIFTTYAMARIYWYIRKIQNKAAKWSFPRESITTMDTAELPRARQRRGIVLRGRTKRVDRDKVRSLQSEVSWQSALYLFALYLSWFVQLCVSLNLDKIWTSHYNLWAFTLFVTGIQGFLNFLVYVRPRLSRAISNLLQKRRRRIAEKRRAASLPTHQANAAGSRSLLQWSNIHAAEHQLKILLN